VADPVVVLVAPAAAGGTALRDRLISHGFRCELIDSSGPPRGWRAADGDLVLILEQGGYSSTVPVLLTRRGGTRLEGLPLIVMGVTTAIAPAEAAHVDETISVDASDLLLKERLNVWGRWGIRARRLADLETQVRDAQEIDPLTGLPGHRAFQERLDIEVKRSERYGSPLGLILADVEGMRTINDRYGHRTGDRVLREVAETIRRAIRDVDMVARYQGDLFGILLPEAVPDTTLKVVSRLRTLVSNLIFRGESTGTGAPPLLKINIHFGLAGQPDERLRGKGALLTAAEADLEKERSQRTPPAIPA
jgi:diguanylate cyclase (GGDEF)-like protein